MQRLRSLLASSPNFQNVPLRIHRIASVGLTSLRFKILGLRTVTTLFDDSTTFVLKMFLSIECNRFSFFTVWSWIFFLLSHIFIGHFCSATVFFRYAKPSPALSLFFLYNLPIQNLFVFNYPTSAFSHRLTILCRSFQISSNFNYVKIVAENRFNEPPRLPLYSTSR